MTLADVLADAPRFHMTPDHQPINWSIDPAVLQWLEAVLSDNMPTLETGASVSTVLFALKGTQHICIALDQDQLDRIHTYCEGHGIDTSRIRGLRGLSQDLLPSLDRPLAVALIDGNHAFPIPFIDWFYIARRMEVGGLLVVDDTQLKTGRILKDFLLSDTRHWAAVEIFPNTLIAKKQAHLPPRVNWEDQPFMLKEDSRN